MSSDVSTTPGSTRQDRLAKAVALLVGAMFIVFGVWALLAPQGFFDTVAQFEPYNAHFIHDIGAFQIGLGAVLLLAIFVADALLASLTGVAVAAVLHVVSHVIDRDLGGSPTTDIPFFAVIGVVLIAAAAARAGTVRRR